MCLTSFINLTAALILCLLFVHYMLIAEVYSAILRKVVTVDSLQLQQFLYLMFDFFYACWTSWFLHIVCCRNQNSNPEVIKFRSPVKCRNHQSVPTKQWETRSCSRWQGHSWASISFDSRLVESTRGSHNSLWVDLASMKRSTCTVPNVFQTWTSLSWVYRLPQSDSGTYSQSLITTTENGIDHYCIFMVSIHIFNLWTSGHNNLWDHQWCDADINSRHVAEVTLIVASHSSQSTTQNWGATELSKIFNIVLEKILAL